MINFLEDRNVPAQKFGQLDGEGYLDCWEDRRDSRPRQAVRFREHSGTVLDATAYQKYITVVACR